MYQVWVIFENKRISTNWTAALDHKIEQNLNRQNATDVIEEKGEVNQ